jgi:hypothetical protein
LHLRKSAVHLKKVTSVGGTDPAVEVVLRYPKNGFSPADMGLVMAYVGQPMTVTLDAGGLRVPNTNTPAPLDKELERVNGQRPERMQPLPHEPCSHCGKIIGDDPDRGFYSPPGRQGRPLPMHGACLAEFPDAVESGEAGLTDEDREAIARLADNPAPGELAEAADPAIDAAVALPEDEGASDSDSSTEVAESEPVQTDPMLDRPVKRNRRVLPTGAV